MGVSIMSEGTAISTAAIPANSTARGQVARGSASNSRITTETLPPPKLATKWAVDAQYPHQFRWGTVVR